jgi:hypothetical protein
VPLWLELRPANDTDWRRLDEDEASLVAAEERARAMVVCKIVTPDGVRIVWAPAEEQSPARRITEADLALIAVRRNAR